MDQKQKLLVRNIIGVVILLVLLLFVLAYCGVFEGEQSDEAQIRSLMERAQEEINDHDWDDLFDLTDMTEAEKQAWEQSLPQQAGYVQVDSITPRGLITVPAGSTEYELDVAVVAHLEKLGISGPQFDAVECTLFFVKKDGRWYIDMDRSTFPGYVTRPKVP